MFQKQRTATLQDNWSKSLYRTTLLRPPLQHALELSPSYELMGMSHWLALVRSPRDHHACGEQGYLDSMMCRSDDVINSPRPTKDKICIHSTTRETHNNWTMNTQQLTGCKKMFQKLRLTNLQEGSSKILYQTTLQKPTTSTSFRITLTIIWSDGNVSDFFYIDHRMINMPVESRNSTIPLHV